MLNYPSNLYPKLTKSYKGIYPFKLGTTSFIYPDDYVPNVKMLGPFVDEIELLLFESDPVGSLISKKVITDLSDLSVELDLTYNIHLPTDISIADPDPAKQQQAVDSQIRVVERVAPLLPSAYTLHVPYDDNLCDHDKIKKWQDIVHHNLAKILAGGVTGNLIAIETLDYPLEIIGNILSDLNLAVCIDIGHLIVHGYDVQAVFDKYSNKIAMIHLHGVEGGNDHLALNRLPEKWIEPVFKILNKFDGSVSLEIFSFDHLEISLNFLDRCWKKFNKRK